MGKDYQDFLKSKVHADDLYGFKPVWMPDFLFGFQAHLDDWAIRKGRAAILADCGLGKTPMDLVWAENVVRKENRPVLIATPLAVSPQTVREGEKFGVECKITRQGKVHKGINVTNYERLKHFDPKDFAGVILMEGSIIKSFDGKLRRQITDFMLGVKYRLLETATPAPNDYMELGCSSEALGSMGRNQMLGMFFSNTGESTQQWELKGHARKRFWRWVCSWARALRKPSDLGFPDDGFILPPMTTNQHMVTSSRPLKGFGLVGAVTLDEQRAERRATIKERCEKVASLIPRDDYAVVWCHLNPEGDLLERLIPGAVQVSGSDRDEVKEERLTAFGAGQIKVLVTKPKIGGWGLNWQHCNRMTFFPSHSFESWYQAIRRCWRFGQKRPVTVDLVTSQGESRVMANMKRKERQAETMFSQLVAEMSQYQMRTVNGSDAVTMRVPKWLQGCR